MSTFLSVAVADILWTESQSFSGTLLHGKENSIHRKRRLDYSQTELSKGERQ